MRVICKDYSAFEELREAFSTKNDAAFFSERYGYAASKKLYEINKFGYFLPGLLFEVVDWVKMSYGSTKCIAISENCRRYIEDHLMPLKKAFGANRFEVSNVSDDTGCNKERVAHGLSPMQWRDY